MKSVEKKREVDCSSCGGSGEHRDFYYDSHGYTIYTGKTIKCSTCRGSGRVIETYYEQVCTTRGEYDEELRKHKMRVEVASSSLQTAIRLHNSTGSSLKQKLGSGSVESARKELFNVEKQRPKKDW